MEGQKPGEKAKPHNWKLHSMSSEPDKVCRICLSSTHPESRIAPCACSGYAQWVHRECLDSFRIHSDNPLAFGRCLACGVDYTFRHKAKNLPLAVASAACKFLFQTSLSLLLAFAVFLLLGLLPYTIDTYSLHLLLFSHDDDQRRGS